MYCMRHMHVARWHCRVHVTNIHWGVPLNPASAAKIRSESFSRGLPLSRSDPSSLDTYDHFPTVRHNPSLEATKMNEATPTTAALPGKEAQADTDSDHHTNGETAGDACTEEPYEEEEDDDEDITDDEEDMFFDQVDPHKVHRKDSYKEPMGERVVRLFLLCKVI